MKKFQLVSGAFLLSLTGCSSIGSGWNSTVDFIFGSDVGAGQRQETAAKMASDAAGSANPEQALVCLLYTSPSPRDRTRSRMPSSA